MKLLIQWAVTSSILIAVVLAARFLLRDKLSARLRYALWGVVLLRLLVPVQVTLPDRISPPLLASNLAPELPAVLERPLSPDTAGFMALYPAETIGIGDTITVGEDGSVHSKFPFDLPVLDPETGDVHVYKGGFSWVSLLNLLWLVGAGSAGTAMLWSNLRFYVQLRRRREQLVGAGAPIPVYKAEGLPSPCLFGVLRPAVYVTRSAAEDPEALRHVLAHELTHYRHRDHIWSLLRCLALALHWYNPLVWLAVALSKADGELACDEGAVARLGETERIPYGRTLVDMVAARSARPVDLLSCSTAMTGGNKSVKQRVALLVKKPETVKAALFAAIAVVALAAVFVFAGRGPSHSVITYEEFCQLAQSDPYIQVKALDEPGTGWIISQMGGNSELRALLQSGTASGGECSDPDRISDAPVLLFTDKSDGVADSYRMVETGSGCELLAFRMGEKEMIYSEQRIAVFPAGTAEKIAALVREWEKTGQTGSPAFDRFVEQLEGAQEIGLGLPMVSSAGPLGPIIDLEQAKQILSTLTPVVKYDGEWTVMSLSSDSDQHPEPITQEGLERLFLTGGHPLNFFLTSDHQVENAESYWLVPWDTVCLLVQWDTEREEDSVEPVAALPANTIDRLKELASRDAWLKQNNDTSLPLLEEALETCSSIWFKDDPQSAITDSGLLAQAKEILTSGYLIDNVEQTGEGGDYERICIRYNDGRGMGTYMVTNQRMRQELHELASGRIPLGTVTFQAPASGSPPSP